MNQVLYILLLIQLQLFLYNLMFGPTGFIIVKSGKKSYTQPKLYRYFSLQANLKNQESDIYVCHT